jgi:hypothetical protein
MLRKALNVKLTLNDINGYSRNQLKELLDTLEDRACNIDYIECFLVHEIISYNINLIEGRVLHSEY